jgi:hypothetical protein
MKEFRYIKQEVGSFKKDVWFNSTPTKYTVDHLPILPRSIVVANGTEIEAFSSMQALLRSRWERRKNADERQAERLRCLHSLASSQQQRPLDTMPSAGTWVMRYI